MKLLSIVIPIYKTELNAFEKRALTQCCKLFYGKYDIIFVGPKGLNTKVYEEIFSIKEIKFVAFEKYYFESIAGYNKLLLSFDFYNIFSEYKYILIYQTDAYIFKDDLTYWCNQGYDYIGAPFVDWYWSSFYAWHLTFPRRMLKKFGYKNFNLVGNGGLSLRKISSFKFNLKLFARSARNFPNNEDYFFSYFINSYNPFFKVAPFKHALRFSFDENPSTSFALNDKQLPMGCHAWPKYYDFWKDYINL